VARCAAAAAFARFLHRAGRLKRLPRTGWLDRGIPPEACESVADHSHRVALLAWLAALDRPDLDAARVLRLALVHDLAEALAGDPTPYDPAALAVLPDDERAAFLDRRHVRDDGRARAKREAEAAAFAELSADLPDAARSELASLWAELDARTTPEARFVKQADVLETFAQSREYAAAFPGTPVASFAAEADETLSDPFLGAVRDSLDATVIEDAPERRSPAPGRDGGHDRGA